MDENNYVGIIIEESLENTDVLDDSADETRY